MPETIFSKILRGEVPCHKVHEDPLVLAFLDVFPLSEGHTLVIPKEPAPTIDRLSAHSAAAIGRCLPAVARAVMATTGASACNILQNNGSHAHQVVMHVHFHVIPKFEDGAGLGIHWKAGTLDHAHGAAIAAKLAAHIAQDLGSSPG